MDTHTIIIYGPGCARCEELFRLTQQVTNALPGHFELRKETEAARIAAAGVLSTPALEQDGKLLFSGRVPAPLELKKLLLGELGDSPAAPETCSCGCCCGGSARPAAPSRKRFLMWLLLLLLVLGGIRAVNLYLSASGESLPADTPPEQVQP